ncbi:DegT/DnrJ/EryC1/StrS family aminotransferase [Leclercia adecarboxylata]|uniref:DegT/DnrJ/EryC1/StrS family aminotransferase n=1 Tax=Leclercia adecarboxylata TaxID=83655 RepID=UPI0013FD8878|nr:DegT/DnrJ/EryC1/StrS family aminotransferase [Leclercia adecarboxylata]QIM43508.1 DegT/DnrJ/EryC1/StrS family aminotransferase [Leclercia adecarboxylata]
MIPLVKVAMAPKEKLMPALEEVLYSGMLAEGEYVYRFEDAFKNHFKMEGSVLGMSSGTGALHAALTLAGVRQGDEVITTSMTAEPTNLSILYVGAKPVFADVIDTSGNISADSVESLITNKTKAILVVHYAGYPVELEKISKLAQKYNIPLIEDCAHALGAEYNGKGIGNYGDYAIFSLQAIKHMTTVDGGILVVKNAEQVKPAKKFRWFGMEKGVDRTKVDITEPGYKYNMSNVTGAIGLIQLDYINNIIDAHKSNGRYYDEQFARIPGITSGSFDENATPSYWLYTLVSDDWEDIQKKLTEKGVMASKLHRPNHFHTIFTYPETVLPGLDSFYANLLHIPCGWWVTEEQRAMIVDTIARG